MQTPLACHELDAPKELFASRNVMFSLAGRDDLSRRGQTKMEVASGGAEEAKGTLIRSSGLGAAGRGRWSEGLWQPY